MLELHHSIKTSVLNLVMQLPGFSEFTNQPERKINNRIKYCLVLLSL